MLGTFVLFAQQLAILVIDLSFALCYVCFSECHFSGGLTF